MSSELSNLSKNLHEQIKISGANLDNLSKSIGSEIGDCSESWPVSRVRSTFIEYFEKTRDHKFWPSSPVVPVNDPTLLFANAGMNQFKPLFLGTCDPALEMASLKMAVNSQKCIRAGGKHNDLDDVGKDVYHHTFFEMLGNWSFGAYFKEEAISWAWECLTSVYGIDENRIYATYFGGDSSQGLEEDVEAKEIWLRYLPASRVLPFGCKDNFWEMGSTGPCGPCTEIHFDRIGDRDASAFVNADRPDVIEIWNNVFIQFNREADGTLRELPSKHVDTGMGLERLTSVLQKKDSNYDTDIFTPFFVEIHKLCGCRPYQGLVGAQDTDLIDTAYRVIADHIRTLTFAITDGALPSNDGRGYVLRRILRRAVRYGQEILGASEGFFTSLVAVVVENFSSAFPELIARHEFVRNVIADEERSFNRTLDQGVKYFKKIIAAMEISNKKVLSGKDAHILFSSMGFPLDLTELMALERGYTVDKESFDMLMESDRKVSEAAELARKGGYSKDMTMAAEQTAWLKTSGVVPTDNDSKYTWYVTPDVIVSAIFNGRGEGAGFTSSINANADSVVGLIFNSTSFYAESGGQIYDTGYVVNGSGVKFFVENVQTYAGYTVHVGRLMSGTVSVNDTVTLSVDYDRRQSIAPNHTMTHVLNFALRQILISEAGNKESLQGQCEQKGSLVDADKLRFDFSWNQPLTDLQTAQVEDIVNKAISNNLPVFAEVVPLSAAASIEGLRQVFGEKYPDPVRVISVGESVTNLLSNPTSKAWNNLSIEFCGGTHLSNTNEAECFVIAEEVGIAKGIRRITGLTKAAAKEAKRLAAEIMIKLEGLAKLPAGPELSNACKIIKLEIDKACVSLVDKAKMRSAIASITDSLKVWYKANLALRVSNATIVAEAMAHKFLTDGKPHIIGQIDFGSDAKVAKRIQDCMKGIHPAAVTFIVSIDEETERVNVYVTSPPSSISAKEWLDASIHRVGGKGGGKADQANGSAGGGQSVADAILNAAIEFINSKI